MARLSEFVGIEGTDFFEQDRGFQRLIGPWLPSRSRRQILESLHACARQVSGRWNDLAARAARPEHLPRIVKVDRVGNPVERVEVSPFTQQLRREVAEFGPLTRAESEVHRFALIYLLAHNGESGMMCGISCTDGLLRVLDAVGPESLRQQYRDRIASVEQPFAGAQFVTERAGGSDIGAIEAEAEPAGEGTWLIRGEKWYCSNPEEFFLVAARPKGAPAGTRGVALFFVPRVLPDGSVNSLSYRRLKDKLGTQSLPTAEIDFNGAKGFAVGAPEDGFHNLMNYVINTSRMHNAANALGFMHRAFLEARNYARQREAFGGTILGYPLVQESLLDLLATLSRERILFFRLVADCDVNGLVPEDRKQRLWQRCLINMAKYRTAVGLTAYLRDAILLFGANGIIEDFTILPRLLRDALIIETWEGTHNTLALQLVRDMNRFDFAGRWSQEVRSVLDRWPEERLPATRRRLKARHNQLQTLLQTKIRDQNWAAVHARRLVDAAAATLAIAWMAEHALAELPSDASLAILTAVAAEQVWGSSEERLTSRLQSRLAEVAVDLIEERPVSAPSWLSEL